MPYVVVRGNLGMNNTKVFGLPEREKAVLNRKLRAAESGGRVGPDGWGYQATPVQVLNELEYHFGYKVIASASHGDNGQPAWTMERSY